MERAKITALFDKYIKKLRITPGWDVRLELVEDPSSEVGNPPGLLISTRSAYTARYTVRVSS